MMLGGQGGSLRIDMPSSTLHMGGRITGVLSNICVVMQDTLKITST